MKKISPQHEPSDLLKRESLFAEQLAALGVREEDLEEHFIRSSGPGGQNVNKTATCVVLLHRPSGVQVKCQITRNQGRNRVLARGLLVEKFKAKRESEARAARAVQEKKRRQNRPRSGNAKERMLEEKSRRGSRKDARRRVVPDD